MKMAKALRKFKWPVVVQFSDGQFGLRGGIKTFLWGFIEYGEVYYLDMTTDKVALWHGTDYIEKYCKGSLLQVRSRYREYLKLYGTEKEKYKITVVGKLKDSNDV